jgi:quercetin dioxygenase-like cupin family protein
MIPRFVARVLVSCGFFACAALCVIGSDSAAAQQSNSARPQGPPVLFETPLADAPGKRLVVVGLTLPPRQGASQSAGHRHPGSVYVYVTEGTARLGIEGEPVKEVRAGESFFEPPGVLHTVSESASATAPAKAIAVMIVPEGAPLVIPGKQTPQ